MSEISDAWWLFPSLNIDTEISKLLTDWKYGEDILHDIMVSGLKLKILGISSIEINKIKN